MLSSLWFRFALLLAAVGTLSAATPSAGGGEPRAYGQRLVAQYRLPPDTIARYASLAAGTSRDGSSSPATMFADRSPWVGPAQRAGVGQNPYTLVFTVSGVARAAGAVVAQWQTGWEVQESPTASRELVMAVPHMTRAAVAADEALTLTASSARVSFRGERRVAPMLGLVQMRNLDIQEVQLQVWSGAAPPAWPVLPWSPTMLLGLGMACLLVALAVNYGRYAVGEPGAQPVQRRESSSSGHVGRTSAGCVEAEPALDPPAPVALSPEARVMAALHHVLTVGLAVPSVPDEARMQKRRTAR